MNISKNLRNNFNMCCFLIFLFFCPIFLIKPYFDKNSPFSGVIFPLKKRQHKLTSFTSVQCDSVKLNKTSKVPFVILFHYKHHLYFDYFKPCKDCITLLTVLIIKLCQ